MTGIVLQRNQLLDGHRFHRQLPNKHIPIHVYVCIHRSLADSSSGTTTRWFSGTSYVCHFPLHIWNQAPKIVSDNKLVFCWWQMPMAWLSQIYTSFSSLLYFSRGWLSRWGWGLFMLSCFQTNISVDGRCVCCPFKQKPIHIWPSLLLVPAVKVSPLCAGFYM